MSRLPLFGVLSSDTFTPWEKPRSGYVPVTPQQRTGSLISTKYIGLRHRLAHGYFDDINDQLIWANATPFIPLLLAEVESLLEAAGYEHHDREK